MIVLFLLLEALVLQTSDAFDPLQCCSQGFQKASSFLVDNTKPTSCKPGASVTLGASGMMKMMCIGMYKCCCKSSAASQFCQMGVRMAAANQLCIEDKREGGAHQRTCCDCCKRGKAHGLSGGSCTDQVGDGNDEKCISSFQDCCEMAKPGQGVVTGKTCDTFTCDSPDKECMNTEDGPTCKCKKGLREEAGTCIDIDECTSQQFTCHAHAYCSNTKGSYKCLCSDGYFQQGKDTCVKHASKCEHGYTLVNGTCADTDECKSGSHRCPAHSYCMNIKGDYRCVSNCPYPNYEVLQAGVCADVDECEKKTHRCHKNYECVNLIGGFDCKRVRCDKGYKLVNGFCDDIDECTDDPNICGAKGLCRNQHGRYYCDCQAGYSVDPVTGKCTDIDECKLNRAYCNYQCINTEGSYNCKCPAGYEMRSRYCYDNDECLTNPCPNTTQCFNTFGSYECINQTCPSAYYVQTSKKPGGVKNCQKVDCKGDKACSSLALQSVKRSTAKFYDVAEPRDFTFNYWLNYNARFYKVSFALVSEEGLVGNDWFENKLSDTNSIAQALYAIVQPITHTFLTDRPVIDSVNFKGNEEGLFDIKLVSHGQIQITNVKRIKGPRKFHLILNSDINTSTGALAWRYEYHFHIFLSAYRFGHK